MALNRWISAALLVSVVGFAGCTQPTPKTGSTASPVATTAPVQTPDAPVETETPAATETGSPSSDATPGDTGTPVAAAGDNAALLEDLDNADGMAGYEEVKAMTPPASADLKKGQELFSANCATCHGEKGIGDGPAGQGLDPKPRDLTKADEFKYGSMKLALYRTGMYGIEGTGMAPWDGIISPEDMWNIVAYVETLHK